MVVMGFAKRIAVLGLGVLVAAGWVLAGQGSERRAFEIADYYRTAFVGGPVVSPAGDLVAFTVRRYDLEVGESWSEIWTMGTDGSGLRQMTFGRHHDGTPVFFPDGKRFVFVSDREGDAPQLFVMAVDGGEPRQLTDFPMGVADPVVSPDGKFIAVSSEVYPECGADADCNAGIEEDRTGGKLAVHMADELLYRHWTSWRDGKYTHILLVDADSGEAVRDMTPGRWDSPTFSLGGGPSYAFSPDGAELVYVSNHDPDPASSTNADLWAVPVDLEKPQVEAVNLTDANDGWDGHPVFSPDGRFIAYLSQETPGYESDLFRIALLHRATGKIRYLTDRESFDDWVDEVAWSKDGRSLYFQAQQEGRNPLFVMDVGSGKIRKLFADGAIGAWKVLEDGPVIYSRRTTGEPPEIFRAAADGSGRERLTRFNEALEAEVDIRPAEEMWVDSGRGYRIHVFVVKPHGFDPARKYPLILNVHGGPQQQWMDAYRGDWQVYPGKGYVVAFANPTGSPGYGQDFVDAISCDWGGRVFEDLMQVTDALEKLPYVDSGRMGAMGWSYGGYMMMWFEGHTTRFKALAAMMGVYDLRAMYSSTEELWFPEHDLCGTPWTSEHYRKWSPSEFVTNFATPCLVITGEKDYRVPYTQSLEFFTDLQKMKVPSRLVVFPRSGHWPSWLEMAFYYNAHLDWFHRYLGGGEAPWDPVELLRNRVFGKKKDGE